MQQNQAPQQDRLIRNLIFYAPFITGGAGGGYELAKWLQQHHNAETAIERAVGGVAIAGALGLLPRVIQPLTRWYGEGFVRFASRGRGIERVADMGRMFPLPYYIGMVGSGFLEYFRDSIPRNYWQTFGERPLEFYGLAMVPPSALLSVRYRNEIMQTSRTVGRSISRGLKHKTINTLKFIRNYGFNFNWIRFI